MKAKELLDKVIHEVAVNWLIENFQIKDAERFMVDTVRQTLERAVDSLHSGDVPVSNAASEMARDVLLNSRIHFAQYDKSVSSAVTCIILVSTGWLVFQLNKAASTEMAMRLFGYAADEDGKYYDSMDFMSQLSPYEKDAEKVMADFVVSRRQPTKEELKNRLLDTVITDTQGLEPILNKKWSLWKKLWVKILDNEEMIDLLNRPEPNTRPLGDDINAKMICNVLGIFKDRLKIKVSFDNLSEAISPKHSLKNYIRNHSCDRNGEPTNECVFTKNNYNFIEVSVRALQESENQSDKKQTENR